MTTGGDQFSIPYFRVPEESTGPWPTAAMQHLQKENPTLGKTQKVVDAFNTMISLRRLIASVCNEETQPMDNRLTEGFLQGPVKDYIQLLHFAQSHMNLTGGINIRGLSFGWKAFNAQKKAQKVTSTSAAFEYASMLSVAANAYVRIAQREIVINGVEGAKNAFKYFQAAAGLHTHISERFLKAFQVSDKTNNAELTVTGSEQFIKLYQAYAHHAAFIKAEAEMPNKYSILSKLAMEGSNLYLSCATLARKYSTEGSCLLRDMPLDIEDGCKLTAYMLKAKANFFLAQESGEKQAFGIVIARCNKALDALNLANQLATSSQVISREQKQWMMSFRTHVDQYADKAVHENSTLYFEKIPQGLTDPEPTGRPFGKPTPFDQVFPLQTSSAAAKVNDPFFGIIPIHVLQTVTNWKAAVRDSIAKITESAANHKARTNTKLQTYGVHAAIQVATTEHQSRGTIPPDLRKRILVIRGIVDEAAQKAYADTTNGTAIESLVSQIDHVNNVLKFCVDSIVAIEGKFDAEEHDDAVKREAYGAKVWGELRKPLRDHPDGKAIIHSLNDFKSALKKEAEEPLLRARQLLQANLREAMMIDWPIADLNKLMPFTESAEAVQSSEATVRIIKNLQAALATITVNEKEQQTKIADLRAISESDEIAHLLSSTPFEQHQEVLDQSRKVLTDRLSVITALMNANDRLCEEAEAAMVQYATLQSTDGVTKEVQEVCNKIIEALNVYDVVAGDIATIGKFIDTVADQVDQTAATTDSLILTRQMEAEELVSSLDAQVAAKVADMERQQQAKLEAERSKQRQDELKASIEFLEKERAAAAAQQQQQQPSHQQPSPAYGQQYGQQYGQASPQYQQFPQPQQAAYGQQQQPQRPLASAPPPLHHQQLQQQIAGNVAPNNNVVFYSETNRAQQPQQAVYGQQQPQTAQQQAYGHYQQQQQQQPQQPFQYNAPPWVQQAQGYGGAAPQQQQQRPTGTAAPQYAPQEYTYPGMK